MKRDILGVGFDDLTLEEAVNIGVQLLDKPGFHYIVTPNPEFILSARKNAAFRAILNAADLALPDGIGVVYAAKLLGTPLKGKVPGIDFAQGLLEQMAKSGKSLYLLGAKPGVAELAAEKLQKAHPGLTVCGVHDGYFPEDGPVIEAIRAATPDVLFVCLGAPKQELWMANYGPELGVHLAVGLGGSLDVFAGVVERAPKLWQKLGLEWLHRLIREPWRIGRMMKLPLILVFALGARLGGRHHG